MPKDKVSVPPKRAATRVDAVTVRLRDMVLRGELEPGQRVPESDIATALGVSRTPVRVALGILRAEGLLDGEANRGFTVRRFTEEHLASTFDVRGVLEGLACRTIAEEGIQRPVRAALQQSLDIGEALAAAARLEDGDMRRWASANERFHRTIIYAARLSALTEVYGYLTRLPLASPVAILFRGDQRERAHALIVQSHQEHEQIFLAMVRGESARAEMLVKEHAYRSRQNVQLQQTLDQHGARIEDDAAVS